MYNIYSKILKTKSNSLEQAPYTHFLLNINQTIPLQKKKKIDDFISSINFHFLYH